MKIFFSLLTVAVLLAVAAILPRTLRSRDQAYEDRLLGALAAVERSIAATKDDSQAIGLYAANLRAGSGADHWYMDGVVAANRAVGEPTYAHFNASLRLTCQKLLDNACWQIEHLKVSDDSLAGISQSAVAPVQPAMPRS